MAVTSSTSSTSGSARCAPGFSTSRTWRSWPASWSGHSATNCGAENNSRAEARLQLTYTLQPAAPASRYPPNGYMEEDGMAAQIVRFFSLLFVGLALAPALAHVLQLPHKMDLPGDDYLRVQQLYAGWAWLGVVVLGALISTFLLTILVRTRLRQF